MLNTILNLFGKSPFLPLHSHMEKVEMCVHLTKELFDALFQKDYSKMQSIAEKISEYEHAADLTKNHIRNHLPKSLYLPIDKSHLLEILSLQDDIADKAQHIGVLTTLKMLALPESLEGDFRIFLDKNLESFKGVSLVMKEMHQLLESSFGGLEAEKVCVMVEEVAYKEHEVDVIQRKLLKGFFEKEHEMSYGTFYLSMKIFQSIGSFSNLSEKLANRVRMTLDLK